MKKLLSLVFITSLTFGAQAQDKKFQIGLTMGPTFNWTKIQTTKIEKNGIGSGFTIGVGGNYMFNENVGLAFGLQFDLERFRLNYGDPASTALGDVYYAYTDTEIAKSKDGVVDPEYTDSLGFRLMTRTFRSKYITIPFFLKFSTSMIGKFKYYGKFGTRMSILATTRFEDEGFDAKFNRTNNTFTDVAGASIRTQENMTSLGAKKELTPFRATVAMYVGFEWNFTGNTFMYTEIGFNYGVMKQLYSVSGNLVDKISGATPPDDSYRKLDIQNNPQHIIEIKVGLLF